MTVPGYQPKSVLAGVFLPPATGVTLGAGPLANYATAGLSTGALVYVQNIRAFFVYDAASAAAADQITVVQANGAGRFFRLDIPSPQYQTQTAWFIDSANGFDENTGLTNVTALKTAGEIERRVGNLWPLAADTSITLLAALPASDPLDLTILQKQGGFLRIKGTPTVVSNNVVGAVTALNRATNVPTSFTSVALGAGQAGKRIRITSAGPRQNFLTWLAKDLGGGSYRIPPLTFLNTAAANISSTPDAQGAITAGDTFALETLTDVGLMHLRFLATNDISPPSVNTVPLLMTDIKYNGGFTGGAIFADFPDPTDTPVIYGCDIGSALFYGSLIAGRQSSTTYASASAGSVGYFGSLIAGDISFQTGVMAFLDFDTLVQTGRVRFREGGNGRIGSLGIFDSASDGLAIEEAMVRTLAFLAGVDALYGAGNGAAGVNKTDAGPNYTYVTKPSITGSVPGTNDAVVGGTAKAWGAIPFINAANNAAIVAFA